MGLFGGIKDTFKKSEAAVVVQNLLEHQSKIGWFAFDPAKFANTLVQTAWEEKPDIFSGKFGQRPHKLSTAAIALAGGALRMSENDNSRMGILVALGTILTQVHTNGQLYPFNSLDTSLFDTAGEIYLKVGNEMGIEM